MDLAKAIPAWLMHATAEALFGNRFLDEVMPAPLLLKHLATFDAEFEVCAGILDCRHVILQHDTSRVYASYASIQELNSLLWVSHMQH